MHIIFCIIEMVICIITFGLILNSNWYRKKSLGTELTYYGTSKSVIVAAFFGIALSLITLAFKKFTTSKYRTLLRFLWCIYILMACWFWVASFILFCGLEQRRDRPDAVDVIFLLGECFALITAIVYSAHAVINCKYNQMIIFNYLQTCFVLVIENKKKKRKRITIWEPTEQSPQ